MALFFTISAYWSVIRLIKSSKYSNFQMPKISIIIPMYNTEKYIQQCLESLLNQNFQQYEVIIIDDCSADKSTKIVEKMAPKFNSLQLIKRSKNSAAPGILRNIGIGLAKGKYLLFMDSDDVITKTALEELYRAAEDSQADVIHEEKFLITKDRSEELTNKTQLIPISWERKDENGFVTKNTTISEDMSDRLQRYSQGQFYWNTWSKLFKREFIIKNHILFPDLFSAEDMIFCFKCLCLAKNYVRVPNVVYFYRIRQGSIAHHDRQMEDHIQRQVKIIIDGSKCLNDFMKEFEIFDLQPEFRQNVLDIFIREHFRHLRHIYANTPVHEINEILYKEFLTSSNVDASLISYFFSEANLFRVLFEQAQHQIAQLQEELANLRN